MAIDAMEHVFRLEGEGQIGKPQRVDVPTGNGWLRLMPVVAEGLGLFGYKAMNLMPKVGVRYAIHLYDLADGALLGILDAQLITVLRTAATSAIATRRLARDDVKRIAIIGTGTEARMQLEAMQFVRPAQEAAVYSRSEENRARFIADMAPKIGVDLVDCDNVGDAVRGADVVVLATKSPAAMFLDSHLEPGMHVSSVGSARLDQFELAAEAFARFDTVVCDSSEHVFTEAGDAKAAVDGGYRDTARIHDLSDLIVHGAGARAAAGDITLFKSVGTATQDLALAAAVLGEADECQTGRVLPGFPKLKAF